MECIQLYKDAFPIKRSSCSRLISPFLFSYQRSFISMLCPGAQINLRYAPPALRSASRRWAASRLRLRKRTRRTSLRRCAASQLDCRAHTAPVESARPCLVHNSLMFVIRTDSCFMFMVSVLEYAGHHARTAEHAWTETSAVAHTHTTCFVALAARHTGLLQCLTPLARYRTRLADWPRACVCACAQVPGQIESVVQCDGEDKKARPDAWSTWKCAANPALLLYALL